MTDGQRGAFDHLAGTIPNHFLLHFYAAVFRCVHGLYRLGVPRGETLASLLTAHPFLQGYLDDMEALMPRELTREQGLGWWAEEIADWEAQHPARYPLTTLEQVGVDFLGRLVLVTAGLVEEDSRFGTLFAELQQPLAQRRPTWELVGHLLAAEGADPTAALRTLLQANVVAVVRRDVPRAEWELMVPRALWEILREGPGALPAGWGQHHEPGTGRGIAALSLPESWLAEVARVPRLVQDGQLQSIVVRGGGGSGRGGVLTAVAHELGLGTLELDGTALAQPERADVLGPLCLLTHSMPVLRYAAAPGETVTLPDLSGYPGPLGVVLGREGGIAGRRAERCLVLTVPAIMRDLRQRHWVESLREHAGPDLEQISARFQLPGEHIRRVGALAITQAALQGRQEVQLADVQVACRDLRRQGLDTLAVRLDPRGGWDDLVLSDKARAQLRELELRCRHRETLLEHLNAAMGHNTGVRALFSGPSGTGKTMTARILASVLGMDLYRVDLAAVINKYIGETEKNLSQVLSRAEELDVILLLDEGDSLLAKRSDVRSSNDRHANMETNYLLQRLEAYRGIVLVTTNFEESIDRAFQRRMDVVVSFTPPQPAERLRIWQVHLPLRHTIAPDQLEEAALRCVFTGGQIRNAVLKATLLAVAEDGPVTWVHLLAAIQGEYNKAGTTSPFSGVEVRATMG